MKTLPAAIQVGVPWRRLVFSYDAVGRRVRKLVAHRPHNHEVEVAMDRRSIYDRWNLIAEIEVAAGVPAVVGALAWGA